MTQNGMVLRNLALVGTQAANIPMPAAHRPTFEAGCALVFARWTALQLGVANGWGGADSAAKAQALLEDAIEWFYTTKDVEPSDLEDLLDEALQMDFSIQAEDDSCYQVARSLVNLHNQVAGGDFTYVAQLRASAPAAVGASAREARPAGAGGDEGGGGSSSSSSGEEGEEEEGEEGGDAMDVDAPPARAPRAAPAVDEDGFTAVARRSRR